MIIKGYMGTDPNSHTIYEIGSIIYVPPFLDTYENIICHYKYKKKKYRFYY